eukprot:TRINITY_DN9588_c0_g3_i1.p1 TRINITY_DN9588_c0_g3~~TRINITY_DN9588_c0_g3_i1.p1  ORF type:complete len:441 (+),score=140.93 TRINITY_DN9588_c0_g3_i1:146-1468(+)
MAAQDPGPADVPPPLRPQPQQLPALPGCPPPPTRTASAQRMRRASLEAALVRAAANHSKSREREFAQAPSGCRLLFFPVTFMLACAWTSITYVGYLGSQSGTAGVLVFAALMGMTVWCWVAVATTPPGEVPASWKSSGQPHLQSLPQAHSGQRRRYCRKCRHWRPPRADHCEICGKCVLRYDHHCMLIGCCIGFHNHKQYVLFCTYLVVVGVYILATAFGSFHAVLPIAPSHSPRVQMNPCLKTLHCPSAAAAWNFVVMYLVVLFGTLLSVMNMVIVFRQVALNKTDRESGRFRDVSPYDGGLCSNVGAVFGDSVWLALLPVRAFPDQNEAGEVLGVAYEKGRTIRVRQDPVRPVVTSFGAVRAPSLRTAESFRQAAAGGAAARDWSRTVRFAEHAEYRSASDNSDDQAAAAAVRQDYGAIAQPGDGPAAPALLPLASEG